MKANHVPRSERLKNRIQKLRQKLPNDGWGKFGRGNPYQRCLGCDKAEPEISISGHGSGCSVEGVRSEIRYYESLLG